MLQICLYEGGACQAMLVLGSLVLQQVLVYVKNPQKDVIQNGFSPNSLPYFLFIVLNQIKIKKAKVKLSASFL